MFGVLCDKRVPTRLKGRFYRMTTRIAILYGMECWATKKQHIDKMSVDEISDAMVDVWQD